MGLRSKRCAARKKTGGLKVALYAVSTVQEEIGLRGAIDQRLRHQSARRHRGRRDARHRLPDDRQDARRRHQARRRAGHLSRPEHEPASSSIGFATAAETAEIPVQWGASGRGTGTDANAIQLARGGVAAGLVSIPNRYMHSAVEMISLDDIDQAADLLAEFALGIEKDADFTPR